MRPTVLIAFCAVVVFASFSALSATPEHEVPTYAVYEVPTYDVKITLKNQDEKKKEIVLKATVIAQKSEKLSSPIWQRPFVTGLKHPLGFTDSTVKEPIIQVINFGAVAEVYITETDNGAFAVDATIEISDSGICSVGVKKYPGTTDDQLQTLRITTAKKRLIETITSSEQMKCTLDLDGHKYDAALTVNRTKAN